MFVDQDLKAAVQEAEEFKFGSEYGNLICLQPISTGGVRSSTFESALQRITDYCTTDDTKFYREFYKSNSKPLCVLPKNHSNVCKSSFQPFYKSFQNKLKDCDTTPGDDDILFKNRANRFFPIQVTKRNYTVLNAEFKWKSKNIKLKAAAPVENSGTPFTIATASFDFASLLLLQKGVSHTLPSDVHTKLKQRAQLVVEKFNSKGIYIVDHDGFLCDPVLGCTLEPDWYRIEDDKSDPNQIQFGHVEALRPDKYMTRGMNVLPITRRGNSIQSDTSLSKVHNVIKVAYEHTRPR
jgi:hypothetical protein